MRIKVILWAIAACCLAACSKNVATGRRCIPGDHACAASPGGGAGTVGQPGANAGAGGGGALGGGTVGLSEDALKARIEDLDEMTIEVITLACAGDCADVQAVASGGNAPYVFAWEDGSTDPTRHVCLDASQTLTVSVTDTAIAGDEFGYEARTASAELTANVLDCSDAGVPRQGCDQRADAESFDPIVKWSWAEGASMVTPLVANLTDDNADGVVDLDDTPDIVLTIYNGVTQITGALVVLDGRLGTEHFRIANVAGDSTPALGDIDGDGRIDIVALLADGALAAFDSGGRQVWSTSIVAAQHDGLAIAIADLDQDGSPEIVAGEHVFDAHGSLLWSAAHADVGSYNSATAADLDGDGKLEVIWGAVAHRHDGSEYYRNEEVLAAAAPGMDNVNAYTTVADLDADQVPEVVVSTTSALFVLDRDGETLRSKPNTIAGAAPTAIHDLNGDGRPEILLSDFATFDALSADLTTLWSMPVSDPTGNAAATAFDFLGDGSAEAVFADEQASRVFAGADGHVIFVQPRVSGTIIEYPSVADVDNDGSADILIVSGRGVFDPLGLDVISDRTGRWIPARRIFNQDTYHVTNVNEDGTIPAHETPSWKLNNSFRAQAQIDSTGTVCVPRAD